MKELLPYKIGDLIYFSKTQSILLDSLVPDYARGKVFLVIGVERAAFSGYVRVYTLPRIFAKSNFALLYLEAVDSVKVINNGLC
jgi:hypothetical protein